MKLRFVFIFLLFSSLGVKGQDAYSYYRNFVIANNKIYTLSIDGVLKIFDADKGKLLSVYNPKIKIRILSLDKNNQVVIADSINAVKKLNNDKNIWTDITMYSGEMIQFITFNSKNNCFLITDKGITNATSGKSYMPKSGYGWEAGSPTKSIFMDSNDNLWIENDRGEWGADLFIFNTINNGFSNCYYYEDIPVFEFKKHLFAYHFDYTKEGIVQYDKASLNTYEGQIVYNDKADKTYPKKNDIDNRFGIYIFTYNPSDGFLYFLSSKGLLRGNPVKGIHQVGDLTFVRNIEFPKYVVETDYAIHRKFYRKREGKSLGIAKMQFTKTGKLVLMSADVGFYLLDGAKLTKLE